MTQQQLADAMGLGKVATAHRFEELAAGLPDSLHQTVASLPAVDQDRPIVANYITEQTQRARRCEQIAETAARRAAPRRAAPRISPRAQLGPQTTTCQHPCPTKGGKPCGKPVGPSGRCGVPGHEPRRS